MRVSAPHAALAVALGGAVAINLCGELVLTGCLVFGDLALPLAVQ